MTALWPLAASTAVVAVEGLLLALFLALSASFSGARAALLAIDDGERERLRADGDAAARRVLRLLDRPRRISLTLALLGTLANVGAVIVATILTVQAAAAIGWRLGVLLPIAGVALGFLLVVVGEVLPRLAALRRPVGFARAVSWPTLVLARLFSPITALLAGPKERARRRPRSPEPASSDDGASPPTNTAGIPERSEQALLHSIAGFGEMTVREVMISRVDVFAIPETATLEEALELIHATGRSRYPLYRDHLDHILGVVYTKDLIPYLNGASHRPRPWGPEDWAALVRPPLFVPLSRRLDDMLAEFQSTGTHIAIVVDEYGGTAGIVTLEDILEEIVGDIRDEHDLPEPLPYEGVGPGTFRVDGGIDLDDLADALGLDLDTESFDFETLGGLVFHCLGRIPDVGEEAEFDRLRMRVEEVENNRIKRVLVKVLSEPVGAEAGDDREERRAEG